MFTFVLIVVALLADASESKSHQRILGGQEAPLGKFPYQVSVQKKNRHYCGGSIINNRYILTAGNCVHKADTKTISVMAGTIDWKNKDRTGVRYQIKNVVFHEKMRPFVVNDIALLKTAKKITFGKHIKPIALGKDFVKAGEEVIVSGWGYIKNEEEGSIVDLLHFIKLKTVTNAQCEEASLQNTGLPIMKGHICTLTKRGEGMCIGDAGNGVANKKRNKLVGVVLRGNPKIDELQLCATGFPDVHTRVSEYVDWVKKHTK